MALAPDGQSLYFAVNVTSTLTRATPSTRGAPKTKFLSVQFISYLTVFTSGVNP